MILIAAPLIHASGRVLSTLTNPPAYFVILQVSSSTASLIASTIIVFAITCCGSIGLSTPYRRIIFGISFADILQSFALLVGPIAVPPTKQSGDAGTEAISCKANGFMLYVGGLSVTMYTFSLCLYYLCKLRYKMSDDVFRYKIEKKLHIFIVVFCLVVTIAALSMDTFHTNPIHLSFCYISNIPTGCDPDIGECDPNIQARVSIFLMIIQVVIPALCFIGITITMGLLYQHAFVWNQTIEREVRNSISLRDMHRKEKEGESLEIASDEAADEEMEDPLERVQNLSRLYRREITIQATSYFLAFCFTYIPMMFGVILDIYYINHSVLDAIVIFTYPLGGFLNILVYTRPKVASLRRDHPECSRLRGFWLVLRAGGEIPNEVDLSLSCCQDCCGRLDSERQSRAYENSHRPPGPHGENSSYFPRSLHLSSIGF